MKLTVDWTRHAESCSNYAEGIISDKFPEKYKLGYNKLSAPEAELEIPLLVKIVLKVGDTNTAS